MPSLFDKIFNENLKKVKKEKELYRFQEDIGPLIGRFSWKQLDAKTGKLLAECEGKNQITELSKSTVIRLISQGVSPYLGQITPSNLKISKMRFGNAPFADHNTTDELKLAYYDDAEKVYRDNATTPPGSSPFYCGAGGRSSAIASEAAANVNKTIAIASFGGSWAVGQTIEINITDPSDPAFQYLINERPPSHKTFKIQFKDGSNVIKQEIQWNGIYSRTSAGNLGSETVVASPPIADVTATKLIWNPSQKKWKLLIALTSNLTNQLGTIVNMVVSFKIGNTNIINSVVPKTGQNAGSGTQTTRFTSADYYDILSGSTQYTDSPGGSFIDDYSVTFSTIQNGSEGNGTMGNTYPVVYTEAALMSADDTVFSIIRFEPNPPYGAGSSTPSWAKDSTSAFLLSWSISAAL